MIRILSKALILGISCFCVFSISAATIVRMETNMGNIDIELHPETTPHTVRNFLYYVNSGSYDNSMFHRSINNFIIQGGGIKFDSGQSEPILVQGRVINEPSLSNVRGTICIAKPGNDIHGANSQWFFNVIDNTHLDTEQWGSFTVFGTVIAGMDVVDAINSLNTGTVDINLDGQNYSYSDVPFMNGSPSGVLQESEAVIINSVYLSETDLEINSGLNGTWYNQETSGSGILIEILPASNLAFMAWFTWDTELPDSELSSVIGNPGQRWLTGLGVIDHDAKTITFDLTNSKGGLFDNELDVENSDAGTVGSVVMGFTDCENATITYNMLDSELTNTRNLIRITSENTELCQKLSLPVLNY